MAILIFLALGTVIFLIVMGISFRNAPKDPYEKEEDERLVEMINEHNAKLKPEVQVIVDDGEEDEELDEEPDNQNEEDQD